MNIVGLSAFYHEAACCLLQDGRLVAAASEERFTRVKHDARLPVEAFRYCLEAGGLDVSDVDVVAYYERPAGRLARQLWAGPPVSEPGDWAWLDPGRPERAVRERLGYEGPLTCVGHHRAHAASAFFFSGFDEAAVLTVDGVGEWATTTYGVGRAAALDCFEEVRFPHSLGLFYAALTAYLGFRVNNGEYKVMGLAAYGRPRYAEALRRVLRSGEKGQYALDLAYFEFLRGPRMFSDLLCELLGAPPRPPESEILPFHCDVACSLQRVLEEILLEKARYLHRETGSRRLCMAGGVALNAVANGRIRREGPFRDVFVQPAAGDAGGCLGAAAAVRAAITGAVPVDGAMTDARLGPAIDPAAAAALLAAAGVEAADYRGRGGELADAVAGRLARGQFVGRACGRMEFGPRALGARSILADPRDPGAAERLNRAVKRREAFRPFAPSVLAGYAGRHLDLDHPAPFMLETCAVASPLDLPAVTHADGSTRPQTVDRGVDPRYAALLDAFHRRTGCPMLLNTSFNVRGEPIVCTPVDALAGFARMGLDALVLDEFLVDRRALPEGLADLLEAWPGPSQSAFERPPGGLGDNLYTFV